VLRLVVGWRAYSTWRTLFVCNEWNELQTVRLTSPEFTLMTLLLLLYGFQLESLGAFTPNSEQLAATAFTPQSLLLRFALSSSFYLALAAAQVREASTSPPRRDTNRTGGRGAKTATENAANRNGGDFGWEMSSHGCFATPADPSPGLQPVSRGTRAPRKCGCCPSLKGHFLSPRAQP
jgi:hypothetical protein